MNERERSRLVFVNLEAVKKSSTGIQPVSKPKKSEVVEVLLPGSMHTGQIIMLTKLLAKKDRKFYDFSTGKPVYAWKSND